jgi:hypothetical protein
MFKRGLFAVMLSGLAGCATSNQEPITEIPTQYHGQWVVDESTCNIEGMGNDGDMYITATEVSFHAEPYRVKSIRKQGRFFSVTYDPPKQQYMVPPAKLYLSADGEILSGLWHRCAKPMNR